MSELLVTTTSAYLMSQGEEVPSLPGGIRAKSLAEWTYDDWKIIEEEVCTLTETLLRRDADVDVTAEDGAENSASDSRRGRSDLYTKPIERVQRCIGVHAALSPIRKELMDQVTNENLGDNSSVTLQTQTFHKAW